jgi:hypothetical protein
MQLDLIYILVGKKMHDMTQLNYKLVAWFKSYMLELAKFHATRIYT